MNNKIIGVAVLFLILGALVGVGVTKAYTSKNNDMPKDPTSLNMGMDHSMSGSMSNMSNGLKGKTGTEFDKEFISEMIVHHQGAIDMANLALNNAERQEIKDLAKNIISAQNLEIDQMKQWQKNWYNQ